VQALEGRQVLHLGNDLHRDVCLLPFSQVHLDNNSLSQMQSLLSTQVYSEDVKLVSIRADLEAMLHFSLRHTCACSLHRLSFM